MIETLSQIHFLVVTIVGAATAIIRFVAGSSYQITSELNSLLTGCAREGIQLPYGTLNGYFYESVGVLKCSGSRIRTLSLLIRSVCSTLCSAMLSVALGIQFALQVLTRVVEFATTSTEIFDDTVSNTLYRNFGSTTALVKEPTIAGSVFEVTHSLLHLLKPFTSVPPLQLHAALSALSDFQDIVQAGIPSLPLQLVDFSQEENKSVSQLLTYGCTFALAAYQGPLLLLWKVPVHPTLAGSSQHPKACGIHVLLGLPEEAVVLQQHWSGLCKPAHYVIVDHQNQTICVTIRGSGDAFDVVTDLCCGVQAKTGTHCGMERSAEYVVSRTTPTVRNLCIRYPDYNVLVVGHSLGGGTATLVTRSWLADPDIAGPPHSPRLHGFSFGPPCVVSKEISIQLQRHVTSVAYGSDNVSRISWGSASNLDRLITHLVYPERRVFHASRQEQQHRDPQQPSLEPKATPRREQVPMLQDDAASVSTASTYSLSRSLLTTVSTLRWPMSCLRKTAPTEPADHPPDSCCLTLDSLHRILHIEQQIPNGFYNRRTFSNEVQRITRCTELLTSEHQVLLPAGRMLVIIPANRLSSIPYPIPSECITPSGRHVIAQIDTQTEWMSMSQILLHRTALVDHLPCFLADSLDVHFDKIPTRIQSQRHMCP